MNHIGTGIRQLIVFCIALGVGIWAARTFLPELWHAQVVQAGAVAQTQVDSKVDKANGAAIQSGQASCAGEIAASANLAAKIVATTKAVPVPAGQQRQLIGASTIEAGLPPP